MRVELLKVIVQPVFVVIDDGDVEEITADIQVVSAKLWNDPAYPATFRDACKMLGARYIAEHAESKRTRGNGTKIFRRAPRKTK